MRPEDTICIVVLGMHGGGTSLVALVLHTLGVQMHPNLRAIVKGYRTYEDGEFAGMNARILHKAGGNFRDIPSPEDIIAVQPEVESDIVSLIHRRADSPLWGYKDPRSAITIPLYHPHLPHPRYILITRDPKKVAHSMMSRAEKGGSAWWGKAPGFWKDLATEHYTRARTFLREVDPPQLTVDFDDLVGRERHRYIKSICRFVGADPGRVPTAINCIRIRR